MTIAASRTRVGKCFTEGARQLWECMRQRGLSQGQLGREIGLAPGVVSRWLYGDRLPRTETIFKLQRELGIDVALWGLPPKVAFVPPAVAARPKRKKRRSAKAAA